MPSRKPPPTVQLVGEERDLLVRVEDAAEACRVALAWLAAYVEAVDDTPDGFEIAVRRVMPVRTYRWVPAAPGDDEGLRYLHPAKPGRQGAFRARLVEWGYAAKSAPVELPAGVEWEATADV